MRVLAVFAAAAACAVSVWPGLEDLSLGVAIMLGYGVIALAVQLVRR